MYPSAQVKRPSLSWNLLTTIDVSANVPIYVIHDVIVFVIECVRFYVLILGKFNEMTSTPLLLFLLKTLHNHRHVPVEKQLFLPPPRRRL
jgi:hypothetical protein